MHSRTRSWLSPFGTSRVEVGPLEADDENHIALAIAWDHANVPRPGWTHARMDELFDPGDPNRTSMALRRGPTLVGVVTTYARGRTLEVDGLVLPAWRGLGYAREVLGELVRLALEGNYADTRDFGEVRLSVRGDDLAAIRVARAVGLTATASAGSTDPDGARADLVVMSGGPELAGQQRMKDYLGHVARLIATLDRFEARIAVERNQARAGRELVPGHPQPPLAFGDAPAALDPRGEGPMGRRPAFYSARAWLAPATVNELVELAAAGCPPVWLLDEAGEPADPEGRYAWIALVAGRLAGIMVARVDGDALHLEGWLVPSLRGLGLGVEAVHALARELLVRLGHVPDPSAHPSGERHSPTRIVIAARDEVEARVAERCGAQLRDGVWVLDRAGHTSLGRAPVIGGEQVARLIASLWPSEGAELERVALKHHQRWEAALEAVIARDEQHERLRGVLALVHIPPTQPAADEDVAELLRHAWADRIEDALAVVHGRLFSDAQLQAVRANLDDSHLPEWERCLSWVDFCAWLAEYERLRRG